MTAEYVIALLGLLGSLGAVVGLVWAVRHRQLQIGDQAMYEAMTDDEADYTASPQPPGLVPRRARRIFIAALLLVFLLIGWLIVQTVRVGTSVVHSPSSERRLPNSE